MTRRQQSAFDRANRLGQQAASCTLYGYHGEAAHLWLMAAICAATPEGQDACMENARESYARMTSGAIHEEIG